MIITELTGREILDSRGRPTVEASCVTRSGARGTASVPSGRSTGRAEAVELRDGDPKRYRGLGCRRAAANVSGEIAAALRGESIASQRELDERLCRLDGSANKARLGANALLAVSVAAARAQAAEEGVELFESLAALTAPAEPAAPLLLPRLTINLFSGGKHAGKQVAIQDLLVVPVGPSTIDASLAMMYDIYQRAAEIVLERWGMRLLTADEGGLAPPFATTAEMLETGVQAIEEAGYRPGEEAALAVDVASSHFYADGRYRIDGRELEAAEMVALLEGWVERFPILSVEDGLAEEDWEHWPELERRLRGRALVLGDDLLCTNPTRIQRAIESGACDSLLLKVNQIGTLTEAAEALDLARSAGWAVTVSVRSGETEDAWAADLAVGWQGDQFKNGSITQSERLAKYNRLLQIEQITAAPVRPWALPGRPVA